MKNDLPGTKLSLAADIAEASTSTVAALATSNIPSLSDQRFLVISRAASDLADKLASGDWLTEYAKQVAQLAYKQGRYDEASAETFRSSLL